MSHSMNRILDRRSAGVAIRFFLALLLLFALHAIIGPVAAAQEFRIYTRVSQEMGDAPAQEDAVVARTLTLFHAGKAYDYIQSVGEVIIFEPAAERFTILSTTRSMSTQVELDQLQNMLGIARKEVKSIVETPKVEGGPTSEVAQGLLFQLDPSFEVEFQKSEMRLTLSSPTVKYQAKCSSPKSPEAVDLYLRYADWTSRLNYVLHPQTLYPASRLKLNDELRGRKVMPTEVRLSLDGENPLRFKAEHEIHWQFDKQDYKLIGHWETMLKDRGTRQVSFREYQRAMLVSLSRRGN